MNSISIRVLKHWLPLAVGLSVCFFTIYVVIQQDLRIGANDPQIQLAEDLAQALQSGKNPSFSEKVDVSQSLAPFAIVYDGQGNVIHSSATLNGRTPELPHGALTASKDTQLGQNRITWQPQNGVRLASVIVPYTNGYVLVGRNIHEIEMRESQQFNIVLIGYIASLFATFASVIIMQTVAHTKLAIFKKK